MSESANTKPTNVLAVISLGFGIASLLGACLTGVPAVFCGHWSLAQIRAEAGAQRGEGLAKAGLILGYLGIAAGVVGAALILIGVF